MQGWLAFQQQIKDLAKPSKNIRAQAGSPTVSPGPSERAMPPHCDPRSLSRCGKSPCWKQNHCQVSAIFCPQTVGHESCSPSCQGFAATNNPPELSEPGFRQWRLAHPRQRLDRFTCCFITFVTCENSDGKLGKKVSKVLGVLRRLHHGSWNPTQQRTQGNAWKRFPPVDLWPP